MASDTSTPAAGQAANPFQQAAQTLGQQPEQQPAGGQGTENQYLTRAEADALEQRILRSAQSLVDKSSSRIEAKVKEVREQMGGQLTPEQEASLRANLAKQEPSSSSAPVQGQPAQAQPEQGQIDPAIAVAFKTMQKAGVTIEETDPEFAKIAPYIAKDGTVDDPEGLLGAVKAGIAAKTGRLASKANPAARVPMGGPIQPGGRPRMTGREMLAEGLKDKQ